MRGERNRRPEREEPEAGDGRCESDADLGLKIYKGWRKDGSIWERVKSWFGFKLHLHLMVDADYELPVGYEVTKASVADTPLPISLEIGFQGWWGFEEKEWFEPVRKMLRRREKLSSAAQGNTT
ncbi:MAG: hypothetical protein JRG97_14050 [Deltaproteobacteria bacterium]|nr:hypothetical protein [Deltaproteobacteria bacterium]